MLRRFSQVLIPSPSDLVFLATMFLVLWLGPFISNRDGDLGWHIAIGRVIIEQGAIPTTDLFSFSMLGEPFVPHEWLSEVFLAAAYQLGGFTGVALLTAVVIATTFAGLTAVMLQRGVHLLIILPLIGLGVLASIAHWATRPHVFTFLCTFIWATALEAHRRGQLTWRGLLALLPLMLLWVNLHGAFIIGDALIATYIAGAAGMWLISGPSQRPTHSQQIRDLVILLVACIAISGINPSGFGLMGNNAGFFEQSSLLKWTPEWQSPDFHNPLFYPLLLILSIAIVVSVRRELTPILLLASWAAFSLYSFRNLVQFVIICLPFIAEAMQALCIEYADRIRKQPDLAAWLRPALERIEQRVTRIQTSIPKNVGGFSSLLGAIILSIFLLQGNTIDLWRRGYGFTAQQFPIKAIEQLQPFPPGQRVFNDAVWGGYLSYCCWPKVLVFFDGRIDFYGSDFFQDYLTIQEAQPGWRELLDQHQIDWVIVFPHRPLVQWLQQDPAWEQRYLDEQTVVFVRR